MVARFCVKTPHIKGMGILVSGSKLISNSPDPMTVVSTGTNRSPASPVGSELVNLMRTGRFFSTTIMGPKKSKLTLSLQADHWSAGTPETAFPRMSLHPLRGAGHYVPAPGPALPLFHNNRTPDSWFYPERRWVYIVPGCFQQR